MLTEEEKRLLSLSGHAIGEDWVALRAFWKRVFGKEYGSKCRCNAPRLIASLRKKFGLER